MAQIDSDKQFTGSIPRFYDEVLVPLIFEPYADDLAARLARRPARRVLEVACGTGVVTRRLAAVLDPAVAIVATDLNAPMLDYAAARGTERPVEWRVADAMQLPFDDAAFDAVVCQFGVMFFPDRTAAFAEARRVLRPGGALLFNVWDRIEENVFADCVTDALATLFPDDPPRFLARTPHGYHDLDRVADDLRAGGFAGPLQAETVAHTSRAASPYLAALAYCQGTPLRNEIEARDPTALERATEHAAAAVAARFGTGPIEGKIQAHVVWIDR